MASTCQIYKGGILLGAGSCADGTATISSWVPQSFGASGPVPVLVNRNVAVTVTEVGTHTGRTYKARILADDGGGNLTMSEKCPFVGA
jgi:hypothetical protein